MANKHGTITVFDGHDPENQQYTLEINGSTVARIRPSTVNPDPKAFAERLAECWNCFDDLVADRDRLLDMLVDMLVEK